MWSVECGVWSVKCGMSSKPPKRKSQGAADQGVWALKASGYTIDFCFAW